MSYSNEQQTKLSNINNGLNNFCETPDADMDAYRLNYFFLKQLPMYVKLENKYKDAKKKIREQQKLIELLNHQHFDTIQKYATQHVNNSARKVVDLHSDGFIPHHSVGQQTIPLSETFSKIKVEPVFTFVDKSSSDFPTSLPSVSSTANFDFPTSLPSVASTANFDFPTSLPSVASPENFETSAQDVDDEVVLVETKTTPEIIILDDEPVDNLGFQCNVSTEETTEEVVVEEEQEEEETEEVVVEEEEEETEEVVVEEEEEQEEETEDVVVEEEQQEEEEETEEVVVEEDEEQEEEETEEVVVEEEEEEETEEEGVYEAEINGKRYYITNDVNGTIYAIVGEDDIGDEIGSFVNGKPVFNK